MNNTFSCGICNLKFSVFDDFKGHMGQHVLTTKSQKISPPKRAFPTPPPSAKNVMKPVPTPALATPSSILIQKQQRKVAKRRGRKKGAPKEDLEGQYKCESCDKIFKYKPLLHAHQKIHNQEKRKDYCVQCNSRFINQDALQIHKINCPPKNLNRDAFIVQNRSNATPSTLLSEKHVDVEYVRASNNEIFSRITPSPPSTASPKVETYLVSSDSKEMPSYTMISNQPIKNISNCEVDSSNVRIMYMCKNCNLAFDNINLLEDHHQECMPDDQLKGEDSLIYHDASDAIECSVGEEVVLAEDGFHEMDVNFETEQSDLNVLVSDTGETYVVCLDNQEADPICLSG